MKKVEKSDKKWKEELTEEEYKILRKKGTEPAFSGKLLKNKKKGVYVCAGCGNELFSSEVKFDSGTGWPSFWKAVDDKKIKIEWDFKMVVPRKEVVCAKCGGHLGHVFNDGPKPTGKRYCVNSAALKFKEKKSTKKQ